MAVSSVPLSSTCLTVSPLMPTVSRDRSDSASQVATAATATTTAARAVDQTRFDFIYAPVAAVDPSLKHGRYSHEGAL